MSDNRATQAPFCCRCGTPRQAHCLCYEDVLGKAAFLEGENAKLREALDVTIGHSNCYCGTCKVISGRYYQPSARSQPTA